MDKTIALRIMEIADKRGELTSADINSIQSVWYIVFPNRSFPTVYTHTFFGQESWINWDEVKSILYEDAVNYLLRN